MLSRHLLRECPVGSDVQRMPSSCVRLGRTVTQVSTICRVKRGHGDGLPFFDGLF